MISRRHVSTICQCLKIAERCCFIDAQKDSRKAGVEKSDGLGEIFLTRRKIYRTIESGEKMPG